MRRFLAYPAYTALDRNAKFVTVSSEPIKDLYTPDDSQDVDFFEDIGFPGEFPYTRGIHHNMYRGRLWTMRQFAGFGMAKDTNERFKYLLEHGQDGLSVAFDLPTLMGVDSDDPKSEGEVGTCGVAIDSLADMEVLFERLNAKLRGHYNYYGVCGNYASLAEFFGRAMRILKKWLDRRSQRRSYNCRKWLSDIVTSSHVVASPDILIIAQGDRRITGIVVAAGFSLISLRASKPLITGIMTSIRMRSGTAETASSTASLPFIAGIISNISLSTHS